MFKLWLKLCLVTWCLISWGWSSNTQSGHWKPTYVSQSDLDMGFLKKIPIVVGGVGRSWRLQCAIKALGEPLANLMCHVEGECVLYELLRVEKGSPEAGVTDAVKCLTRYGKGDRPCTMKMMDLYVPFGCIRVKDFGSTVADGRQHCTSLGMDLVSFESMESQAQLENFFATFNLLNGIYSIGFSLDKQTNKYFWVSGAELKLDSPMWGNGQPSKYPNEDFGVIVTPRELHDIIDRQLHFICSFP